MTELDITRIFVLNSFIEATEILSNYITKLEKDNSDLLKIYIESENEDE